MDSTYSLGQRTALANGDPVTLGDTESGGDVGSEVLVTLLVTLVLGDEVLMELLVRVKISKA